ncbi:MAG TPA: hypothetical protein DIT90_11710 [Dehalococcoidia bacterium]|nr:hypothetical protein [Dehalococcoidia bacterium]
MPSQVRRIVFLGTAILTILVVAGCSGITGWSAETEFAETFTLPSARGTEVSLEDYLGRGNVVLVFYEGLY